MAPVESRPQRTRRHAQMTRAEEVEFIEALKRRYGEDMVASSNEDEGSEYQISEELSSREDEDEEQEDSGEEEANDEDEAETSNTKTEGGRIREKSSVPSSSRKPPSAAEHVTPTKRQRTAGSGGGRQTDSVADDSVPPGAVELASTRSSDSPSKAANARPKSRARPGC